MFKRYFTGADDITADGDAQGKLTATMSMTPSSLQWESRRRQSCVIAAYAVSLRFAKGARRRDPRRTLCKVLLSIVTVAYTIGGRIDSRTLLDLGYD